MTKNILLFGKNGQVGSNIAKILQNDSDLNLYALGSSELDFSDLKKLQDFLQNLATKFRPDFIINAAAYTNVDKAESEAELAGSINHLAVAEIAKYCAAHKIWLVHYSTDYVFDGSGSLPFREENTQNLNPLNIYGKTKLAGERAIIASGCNYIILRTSWVFAETGKNFVNTIKKLALEKEELRIINDQIGAPTDAKYIAKNTIAIIQLISAAKNVPVGIYHLTGDEQMSWYDFAVKIIDDLKKSGTAIVTKKIIPIPTSNYPTPAKRPLNSRLDLTKIKELLGEFTK